MNAAPLFLGLALPLGACAQGELDLPSESPQVEPAALADPAEPHGVLHFELRGSDGRPMAGRLTFVRRAGEIPDLFPGVLARPDDLAVRRNVVYSLSGRGAITVPTGDFRVYATRGIEWSQVVAELTIEAVREWKVIGTFANPDPSTLFTVSYGPETEADTARTYTGKDGPVSWTDAVVGESGYLDLSAIDPEHRDNSISFAQTWLFADEPRELPYAMGSDDGCRLWLNGDELYRDATRHGASPLQQVGVLPLTGGWNRVLIGVENGGGATGLYFRIFGDGVRVASEQP